tara:strand:- start:205 stop:1035 length:831 start_codon:yes stop_codon:yes gene_type:complete
MKRRVARVLPLLFLAGLYTWLRIAALEMEVSHLPQDWAVPVISDGQTLMTYQRGDEDGQPVIFIHGTPGSADNWAYFLDNPAPGFRVIAVDRPGFGGSIPSEGLPDMGEQAASLVPLLEGFLGRRPILVGHSLGGPIVAQVAVDYPELVGGIVIVAGSLSPSVESIFTIQYVGDLVGFRQVLPRSFRNSNHELLPLRHSLEKLAPRLAAITCPVVIIHGTEDMLVPFSNVAYMEAHFSEGVIQDIMVLEGENHFLPWTAQERIWAGVTELSRHFHP